MRQTKRRITMLSALASALLILGTVAVVAATEPCGDFGECRVLIEINSTDGDIGFHWLADGDDLISTEITDPNGAKVFANQAKGPLKVQTLTESFGESAERLCWPDPAADPDEEIVTLEEFLGRWAAGTYIVTGKQKNGPTLTGQTMLTHVLPAAPRSIAFDGTTISWTPGNDLGRCGSFDDLASLVQAEVLPVHPAAVVVDTWEVVLVADVPAGNPAGKRPFTLRVPGNVTAVTVPGGFPLGTAVKIEVGAIVAVGVNDNATFTEVVCNPPNWCPLAP
jgi:hypothetical protein